jgi:hypothetical protein
VCGWRRDKIESNKFSKPPKTRSKNTRPIYLLFYEVWGRREREREREVISFPNHQKLGEKNTRPIYCFKSVDGEEERPKTE